MTVPYPYAPEWDELLALGEAIRVRLVGLRYATNCAPLAADQVFHCWADPDDLLQFPAVGIQASSGSYGGDADQSFSPAADEASRFPATGAGAVLVEAGEFVAQVEIVIYCTDPVQRSVVLRAVRDRLQDRVCGADGRGHYGIDLPVARYFGGYTTCHVSPLTVRYEDDADEARRRHRKAILVVRASMPLYHCETAQDLLPRLVLDSVGDTPV